MLFEWFNKVFPYCEKAVKISISESGRYVVDF